MSPMLPLRSICVQSRHLCISLRQLSPRYVLQLVALPLVPNFFHFSQSYHFTILWLAKTPAVCLPLAYISPISMANIESKYDIVIVGAGPVGLLLSLCLSRWGYKVRHIDNRPLPTVTGRADGIQPRSIEILRNLGIKRQLFIHQPARIYDVAFWYPSPNGKGIRRVGTWPSCPRFINTRYPFTALIHQGKVETVFLDEIKKAGTTVYRPWTIVGFHNTGKDDDCPLEVELKNLNNNVVETVQTKYLFSAEGSSSSIREQLGIKVQQKSPVTFLWSVIDGLVRTDFPDIQAR